MNFVSAFQFIIRHYEDIVAAVAVAENMFPAGTPGSQKLDFVKSALQHNENVVQQVGAGNFDALWPYMDKVIALICTYAKSKSVPAPAPAPAPAPVTPTTVL